MSDPNLVWLAAAFGVTWLAIGAYLVRLWRAQREIDDRLSQLSKRDG
jgi:CcmD family protein